MSIPRLYPVCKGLIHIIYMALGKKSRKMEIKTKKAKVKKSPVFKELPVQIRRRQEYKL